MLCCVMFRISYFQHWLLGFQNFEKALHQDSVNHILNEETQVKNDLQLSIGNYIEHYYYFLLPIMKLVNFVIPFDK